MPPADLLAMSAAELRREKRALVASERRNTEMSNEFARRAKSDSVRCGYIESRLREIKEEARNVR